LPPVNDRHFEVHQNYVRALGNGQLAALLAVISRENPNSPTRSRRILSM
jgi:hypothetical protein